MQIYYKEIGIKIKDWKLAIALTFKKLSVSLDEKNKSKHTSTYKQTKHKQHANWGYLEMGWSKTTGFNNI